MSNTVNTNIRNVGIIGVGRVGAVIGALCRDNGYDVTAISARSEASRKRAERWLPGVAISEPEEVAAVSDLLFVTVPDDSIEPVSSSFANAHCLRPGQFIAHASGRCGLDVLKAVVPCEAIPAAIHPVMTFAGTDRDLSLAVGLPFGVTTSAEYRPEIDEFVRRIGGNPFWLREEERALYHAALALGANYLIALVAAAIDIFRAAGVPNAATAISPILKTSLENVLEFGDEALTGPVRRGDIGTIQAHIAALSERMPEAVPAYLEMARFTAHRAIAAELNEPSLLQQVVKDLQKQVMDDQSP